MDTCPVATLDMSHPTRPGVDRIGLYAWMTEQPVQVRQCIGCWVCRTECPTDAVVIEATDSEPRMQAMPPFTATPPSNPDRGWVPLSALTRDRKHNDRLGWLRRHGSLYLRTGAERDPARRAGGRG